MPLSLLMAEIPLAVFRLPWIHSAAGNMLVSIKMILAVFVIALAFRAIAEYQIRIIRVGAAAYRAAMAPALLRRLGRFPHLSVELLFAPDLLRIIFPASCHQEIDQEVQKRHDDRNAVRHASEHQTVEEIRSVKNRQPFRLDRGSRKTDRTAYPGTWPRKRKTERNSSNPLSADIHSPVSR